MVAVVEGAVAGLGLKVGRPAVKKGIVKEEIMDTAVIGWEKRPAWANAKNHWDERVAGHWVTVWFDPNRSTPWATVLMGGTMDAYSLPELLRFTESYIKEGGLQPGVAKDSVGGSGESDSFADQDAGIEGEEEPRDAMTTENAGSLTK